MYYVPFGFERLSVSFFILGVFFFKYVFIDFSETKFIDYVQWCMLYLYTVYILFTHLKILKISFIVLFTHLKIILLQCF